MANEDKSKPRAENSARVVTATDGEQHQPVPTWEFGRWYTDWETNPQFPFVCFRRGTKRSDEWDYYVPMDRCINFDEAWEWIKHVRQKSWCGDSGADDLADALEATMDEMKRRGMIARLRRKRRRAERKTA